MILAPESASESFRDAIKRRVALFRAGAWEPLISDELKGRSSGPQRDNQSLLDVGDPKLVSALRAEKALATRRSRSGASAALSAPANPKASKPGDLLRAFEKLNPQVGQPSLTADKAARRPLNPPEGELPAPIEFSVEEVLKRVRSSNKNSAGGLSGSDYQSLSAWLHEDDDLTRQLVSLLNRIAAGAVPPAIVGLLTAGRGVVIPKDEIGGLRPIVVGHILLRFVGSLALAKEAPAIRDFFLKPVPLQFGVGVQGGCELMAAAISSFLTLHPGAIDIGCDAQNAFNSWDRTRLWSPLERNFPGLCSFGRLLYGSSATILFAEEGVSGAASVSNNVGSRQGCSWGSFCYCLALHGPLSTLAGEFPDLLVLAYADDVHIVGPPARAVKAYNRWVELYESELQGNLRPDKSVCFAPSVPLEEVAAAGLPVKSLECPSGMPVVHDGTRVLGAPVGSLPFQAQFASERVAEICADIETICLMPTLQHQNCLATGSTVHRINHLLRNIAGGELDPFAPVAAVYDRAVLSVPRRLAGMTALSGSTERLASLPGRLGGLGYTTWSQSADSAFLASYVHISHAFPSLFPGLARVYPSAHTLASADEARSVSQPALHAFNALARLVSRAPSVAEVVRRDAAKPIKQLQHAFTLALASADQEDLLLALVTASPHHPRAAATLRSNSSDSTTFSVIASDDSNTFSNSAFEVAIRRRLLLPLTTTLRNESRRCPSCAATSDEMYKSHPLIPKVDEFGDHALHCPCGSLQRIRAWHDPVRDMCLSLARQAGVNCSPEVSNHMLCSEKRPDIVLWGANGSAHSLIDVITSDPTMPNVCPRGAVQTGAAAEVAALSKERAWTAQAEAQGETFYPLAIEAGGTLNARFHEFLQLLAVASSPSPAERAAFMAFALQRVRAVSLKGTCAIILARPVSRTAPGGVHRRGALPLIQPKPRPRVAAFVSPPPRPQPRAAWAGAFPDAPPPWAPLAVPAPVGPPPHRAPQMPGLSRNGAPLPSPTPHVNIAERPPQPPLR